MKSLMKRIINPQTEEIDQEKFEKTKTYIM